jgi:hypothetical protein
MSTKIALKKIKGSDNIFHPDSGLVFRSQKDKVVIGKYEDGEIISLDYSMVELCKKWNFKYDEELLVDDEIEGEEANEDEADDGEDDTNEEAINDNVENETEEDDKQETEETEETEETDVTEQKSNEEDTIKHHDQLDFEVPERIKTHYIMDLTNTFSTELYKTFDLLHQNYSEKLTDLHNVLVMKNKNYDDLQDKLEKEIQDHKNTQNELDKLKAKFEGIKSLFS